MHKVLSNIIEDMGILFLKRVNGKTSDEALFKDCSDLHPDEIQEIYSMGKVFDRCDGFNPADLIHAWSYRKLQVETYRMASQYNPIPKFGEIYNLFPDNYDLYFEAVRRSDAQDIELCFIFLHGFSERHYKYEIMFLFPQILKALPKSEILAVQLPYHMRRSPKEQPYSGAFLFDSCPITTIEGTRQAVYDVSQVIAYAKERYKKVVVGGFSLGGHIAAFLGTCDDRPDLYIMGQAGAALPESLKHLLVCPGIIQKSKRWISKGVDFKQLYMPIELTKYKPIVPGEKVISIAGTGDKLITYDKAMKLRDFYHCKCCIDYQAGHMGLAFEHKAVLSELMKTLKEWL